MYRNLQACSPNKEPVLRRIDGAILKIGSLAKLTHEKTARLVRQRQGRRKLQSSGTRQTFFAEDGWQVVVSADKTGTYPEMERALSQALDEVRHRIDNGRQLF